MNSLKIGIPFWHKSGKTIQVRRHGSDWERKIKDGAIRLLLDQKQRILYIQMHSKTQMRSAISAVHDIAYGMYDIDPSIVDPEDVPQAVKPLKFDKIILEIDDKISSFKDVEEMELIESKEVSDGLFESKLESILRLENDIPDEDRNAAIIEALKPYFEFAIAEGKIYGTNGKTIVQYDNDTWSFQTNNKTIQNPDIQTMISMSW
ncbi:MAG: hypothetical protein GF411_14030 [Candidatus Lokiarchaeota archaeon]|nr:hypothetical protein [Candidatus Lokiarchaeota archaeon]